MDWPGPGSSAASFVRPSADVFALAPQRWDHRFVREQLVGRRCLRGLLGGDLPLRGLRASLRPRRSQLDLRGVAGGTSGGADSVALWAAVLARRPSGRTRGFGPAPQRWDHRFVGEHFNERGNECVLWEATRNASVLARLAPAAVATIDAVAGGHDAGAGPPGAPHATAVWERWPGIGLWWRLWAWPLRPALAPSPAAERHGRPERLPAGRVSAGAPPGQRPPPGKPKSR